jgi:hypothetical protein
MIKTRKIMTGHEWGKIDEALNVPLCARCKWCRFVGYSPALVQGVCIRYAPRPDFATVNPDATMCGEFELDKECNLPSRNWCEIDNQRLIEVYQTGIDMDFTHSIDERCSECNGEGGEDIMSICKACNGYGKRRSE